MRITISRLGGLGDGTATIDGKTVVVPFSAPGDVLEISVLSENNKRILGRVEEILSASKDRALPVCRHFTHCGGCSFQHIGQDLYSEFKQGLLERTLARAGFSDTSVDSVFHAGPGSRRRITLHVRSEQGGQLTGFFQGASNNIVEIGQCPQSLPELEAEIRELPPLIDAPGRQMNIKSVQIQSLSSGLDCQILCGKRPTEASRKALINLAEARGYARTSIKAGSHLETIHGQQQLTCCFAGVKAIIPPDSFLQPTLAGQERLIEVVVDELAESTSIADLYSGSGTFTLPLLKAGHRTASYESSQSMVAALRETITMHDWQNRGEAEARDLVQKPLSGVELRGFDAAVVNPPRQGAARQVKALAGSAIPLIGMVSCFPRSLEKDLATLKAAGYAIKKAVPIDQFHWTPHLEAFVLLRKEY